MAASNFLISGCECSCNDTMAAWRNRDAITVVFPDPPAAVRQRWQLASENGWSHLVCMPNISRQQVDAFIDTLVPAPATV